MEITCAACWSCGQRAPYLHLARTFDLLEDEKGKIKATSMLCNMFRRFGVWFTVMYLVFYLVLGLHFPLWFMWSMIAGDVYFYTVCLPCLLRMCCLQCICAQIRLLQTMKMWLVEFLRSPLYIFFACLGFMFATFVSYILKRIVSF